MALETNKLVTEEAPRFTIWKFLKIVSENVY